VTGLDMKKIVIFGAGNIGRSLVGQLFSRAGYEVVFVDVIDEIVRLLNTRKRYRIEVKDYHSETIWVENVRAVHGRDKENVAREIAGADIIATAVGVTNLDRIYNNIAAGLARRIEKNRGPIDILICENVRDAPKLFREGLSRYLPQGFPLDSMAGLVETSIGKMVPLMTEEQKREDPLLIYAEAYNKIVLDKEGFRNPIPEVEGLEPKENMGAYVDLKIFVHNMGHAAAAYLGYITDEKMRYIWEAISNDHIRTAVEGAMWEAGRALICEHPSEFNKGNVRRHIDDLLWRFGNKALGDTVYRVGRDVPRKLCRNDRLVGALLLEKKHSVPSTLTTLAIGAATLFRAKDDNGNLYPADKAFSDEIYPKGIDYILERVCGLDLKKEASLTQDIERTHALLLQDPKSWFSIFNKISQQSDTPSRTRAPTG